MLSNKINKMKFCINGVFFQALLFKLLDFEIQGGPKKQDFF